MGKLRKKINLMGYGHIGRSVDTEVMLEKFREFLDDNNDNNDNNDKLIKYYRRTEARIGENVCGYDSDVIAILGYDDMDNTQKFDLLLFIHLFPLLKVFSDNKVISGDIKIILGCLVDNKELINKGLIREQLLGKRDFFDAILAYDPCAIFQLLEQEHKNNSITLNYVQCFVPSSVSLSGEVSEVNNFLRCVVSNNKSSCMTSVIEEDQEEEDSLFDGLEAAYSDDEEEDDYCGDKETVIQSAVLSLNNNASNINNYLSQLLDRQNLIEKNRHITEIRQLFDLVSQQKSDEILPINNFGNINLTSSLYDIQKRIMKRHLKNGDEKAQKVSFNWRVQLANYVLENGQKVYMEVPIADKYKKKKVKKGKCYKSFEKYQSDVTVYNSTIVHTPKLLEYYDNKQLRKSIDLYNVLEYNTNKSKFSGIGGGGISNNRNPSKQSQGNTYYIGKDNAIYRQFTEEQLHQSARAVIYTPDGDESSGEPQSCLKDNQSLIGNPMNCNYLEKICEKTIGASLWMIDKDREGFEKKMVIHCKKYYRSKTLSYVDISIGINIVGSVSTIIAGSITSYIQEYTPGIISRFDFNCTKGINDVINRGLSYCGFSKKISNGPMNCYAISAAIVSFALIVGCYKTVERIRELKKVIADKRRNSEETLKKLYL